MKVVELTNGKFAVKTYVPSVLGFQPMYLDRFGHRVPLYDLSAISERCLLPSREDAEARAEKFSFKEIKPIDIEEKSPKKFWEFWK